MRRAPHRPLLAQAPLAQLALGFSAGILVFHFLSVHLAVLGVCCGLLSITTLGGLVKRSVATGAICLTAAFFLTGAVLATLEKKPAPRNQLKRLLDESTIAVGEPVELTGVVDGPFEWALDRFYFTLIAERLRCRGVETVTSGTVALMASFQTAETRTAYLQLDLRHGARLRVMTTLRRADSFRNPGVSLFTEYLDRKGYDATSFVKSPLLIERLDDEPVFLPLAWLFEWRRKLQKEIEQHFSRQTAGVLDAALLGNRYNLSPDSAERFRAGGTFHVLVISGLHISFIGWVVFLITQRLTKRRGLRFLFSAIVLWGYALAVGAEASVVRAALMFTLVALAPIIFRRAASMNALGGSALILLIWRPQSLFDPSFQLTFLSVLGIVILAWPMMQRMAAIGSWQPTRDTPYPPACARWLRNLSECLYWSERQWQSEIARSVYRCKLFKAPLAARLEHYRIQRIARYVLAAIIVSVSVQIVLLPFLIIYFHRVSIASIALNIGVSLTMAALALVALAALVVAQFSNVAAAPLIGLANSLNWLMVHSVDPFARVGLASIRLPHYSGPGAIVYWLYYGPLAVLTIKLWRWNPLPTIPITSKKSEMRMAIVAQILLLVLVILHPLSAGRGDGKLHIDFLDVGQGDSALITMPDGSTLLIDGGGRPSFLPAAADPVGTEEGQFGHETRGIGESVVSEYLWWRGLDSIDYLLATHADADHIDGLSDVARNFNVRAALVGRAPARDPEFQKFEATLRARGIPLSLIGAGDTLRFGGVSASVLWPPPSEDQTAQSRNNDSVALRLEFGNRAILLTGDIEADAESAILNAGQNLRADLVKVAHHGSKTSSFGAFVKAAQPAFAVISVGQTSVFDHPSKEVVERWKAVGAEVLLTGRSGTISLTTDGRDVKVATFVED